MFFSFWTFRSFSGDESLSDEHRLQAFAQMTVVFAPKGTDADGEIERMLRQHSVPKRVVVVSSDHRLHKAASRRRARCVDSEEFWQILESESAEAQAEPIHNHDAKPGPHQNPDELKHWLHEFSGAAAEATDPEGDPPDHSGLRQDYVREVEEQLRKGRLR